MSNISDTIEKFIISALESEDYIEISRNSLAEYFSCAPSQINYVLDTRFTIDRGFLKESKRGGSGFIKISKIKSNSEKDFINYLIVESVGDELTFKRLNQILDKLEDEKIITQNEKKILLAGFSDESLVMPFVIRDNVRAKAFKNVLIELMKK